MKRVFHVQYTGIYTVSIDEQGRLTMQGYAERHLRDQDTVILEPEEAYNLLHFLYRHNDLLVKAIAARQEASGHKEHYTEPMTSVRRVPSTSVAPHDSHLI